MAGPVLRVANFVGHCAAPKHCPKFGEKSRTAPLLAVQKVLPDGEKTLSLPPTKSLSLTPRNQDLRGRFRFAIDAPAAIAGYVLIAFA